VKFAMLSKNVDQQSMIHFVFDNSPDNFLIDSTANGAYILQPKSGTFIEMQEKVRTIFETEQPQISTQSSLLTQEQPTVRVQNGTRIEGLAGKTAQKLTDAGFKVLSFSNAEEQRAQQTILYDFTRGKKDESRAHLETLLGVSAQEQKKSDSLQESDFLIILGSDAAQN